MDWPIAVVLLGVLGTVTAAILKVVPQRHTVRTSAGDKCATKEDVQAVLQELKLHEQYTKQRTHDILEGQNKVLIQLLAELKGMQNGLWNKLDANSKDLVTLLERTRNWDRNNNSD